MLPLPVCFNVHVSAGWYIGLPAATWLIYLADHLMDIQNEKLETPRHVFIRTYKNQITILIGLLLALCIYTGYTYYTVTLFLTGFVLVLFCGLYFALTLIKNDWFRFFYNKELMVAIIYATALYLEIGLSLQNINTWLLYYIALISITYLNLLTISIIELPEDLTHQQFSWVVIIGKKRATVLFYFILTATIILCGYAALVSPFPLSALGYTYMFMAITHWFIYRYAPRLMHHRAYRKWSEITFWLPGILYLFI